MVMHCSNKIDDIHPSIHLFETGNMAHKHSKTEHAVKLTVTH